MVGPPTAPYPSDVDDAIAIAMALNARQLDVDAISVQFGNNRAEPATPKTRELVHGVMRRTDVPVAQGSARALPRPGEACVNDGVRLLAAELRKGPAKILATGPLTDVACLARTFPREAANVTEVLAQIGARPGEPYDLNGRPALFSLNVSADVLATEEVMASPALSGARITASPYHLAGMLLFDDARVDRMGGASPEGRWLRENSRAFREFWRAGFADNGLRPWDQTLVFHLMRPAAYRTLAVGWRMVDCSDPTGRNANTACAGHGPTQFPTRDNEPKQLWLGNAPGQRPRRGLQILDAYAEPADGTRFLDAVTALGR
jgi:pyrimidine-specific ribonucleoside hydrolase